MFGLYVKGEDGKLRPATRNDVGDPTIQLFDKDGKEVKDQEPDKEKQKQEQLVLEEVKKRQKEGEERKRQEAARSAVQINNLDAIEELRGVAKEISESLGASLNGIKERQDKIEQAVADIQEAAKRGFPMPNGEGFAPGLGSDPRDYWKGLDLSYQGSTLETKFRHKIPENKIEPMAKWMVLFFKAGLQGDNKAYNEMVKLFGPEGTIARTALGDTGNVFPVPDIVDSEILAFARERSVTLQYARIWDMTSDKQSFPQESAAPSVAWGNTSQNSDPTVAEVELSAEELSAYSVVKNTTMMDARSDIVGWLTEMMAEAAGLELDNVAFTGNGTSLAANCYGILNPNGANYSVTMSTTSTAFSQITADHLSEMISNLEGVKKMGAMWWMNGAVFHFVRQLKDDQNRPIFYAQVGGNVPPQILGYPYVETIKCPSTSAANTAFVAFGNLRYFAVGRRLGTTSLQVDPYGLWTTNRTRFKIYQRWGLKVGLPKGFVRLLTASS